MGQFSYACKTCGGHEQFDWITPCVVELALTTGKTIHVEGYYDGYAMLEMQEAGADDVALGWGIVTVCCVPIFCLFVRFLLNL